MPPGVRQVRQEPGEHAKNGLENYVPPGVGHERDKGFGRAEAVRWEPNKGIG